VSLGGSAVELPFFFWGLGMSETQNAIDIARLQERMDGIREQQRVHNETTQRRFNEVQAQLTEVLAAMNRGRGAYTASLLLAGALGSAVLAAIKWGGGLLK
jgi:hypothetical protein